MKSLLLFLAMFAIDGQRPTVLVDDTAFNHPMVRLATQDDADEWSDEANQEYEYTTTIKAQAEAMVNAMPPGAAKIYANLILIQGDNDYEEGIDWHSDGDEAYDEEDWDSASEYYEDAVDFYQYAVVHYTDAMTAASQ